MYCSNCGKEISETDKFCSNCGHSIESNVVEQTDLKDETKNRVNYLKLFRKKFNDSYKNFWKNTFNYKEKTPLKEAQLILVDNILMILCFYNFTLYYPESRFLIKSYLFAIILPTFSLFVRRWRDCEYSIKRFKFISLEICLSLLLGLISFSLYNLTNKTIFFQLLNIFYFLFSIPSVFFLLANAYITFFISGKENPESLIPKELKEHLKRKEDVIFNTIMMLLGIGFVVIILIILALEIVYHS